MLFQLFQGDVGAIGAQARPQIVGGRVNCAGESFDSSPQYPRPPVSRRPSIPTVSGRPNLTQHNLKPTRHGSTNLDKNVSGSMPQVSQGVENRVFQRQRESIEGSVMCFEWVHA